MLNLTELKLVVRKFLCAWSSRAFYQHGVCSLNLIIGMGPRGTTFEMLCGPVTKSLLQFPETNVSWALVLYCSHIAPYVALVGTRIR